MVDIYAVTRALNAAADAGLSTVATLRDRAMVGLEMRKGSALLDPGELRVARAKASAPSVWVHDRCSPQPRDLMRE